jgi:phosphopantothenoylcysteine decarboxylase/phosphopantothenate--cysteine ligase
VRRLRDRGFDVRCALTPAAAHFVSPLALEVVSGNPVHREEWLEPNGSGEELHITTAAWADLVIAAPATAHLLSRWALGLADDFATATLLAYSGPALAAPAMHSVMWSQEATRERIAELALRGVRFAGPVEGPLASGEMGMGRMAEVPEIVRMAEEALGPLDLAGRSVLVTAGPTHEPIDPVRYLGNRSSGKMGFAIAAEAARRGAKVILVAGPVSLPTPRGVERVDVATALEMSEAVRLHAPGCDLVVMAAAVADFRPARAASEKIKKSGGVPELTLVRNPDILAELPGVAPGALRVGFAAETSGVEAEARRKLESKDAHLLVANDVSRSDIGFAADENEVQVFRRGGDPVFLERRPKAEIARELVTLFAAELRALRRDTPIAAR